MIFMIAAVALNCFQIQVGLAQCNVARYNLTSRMVPNDHRVLYTRGTQFSTLLYLNQAVSNMTLTFACRARVAADLHDAQGSETCSHTDMSGTSSPWEVNEDTLEFRDEMVKHIRITRDPSIAMPPSGEELVKVYCCTKPNATIKMSVYMLALVQLPVAFTLVDNSTAQRRPNPAFVELSPCSCDLTTNQCDLFCCCDDDCTGDIDKLFSGCFRGLKGGRADMEIFRCGSDHHNRPDWFPVLCVYSEINALLGMFYMEEEKIMKSAHEITDRLESRKDRVFSFEDTKTRAVKELSDRFAANYTYGETIKTARPSDSWKGAQEDRGIFSLPQKTLNGECLIKAPVQFLKPLESRCNYRVTKTSCENNMVFNVKNFPISTVKMEKCNNYILANGSHISNTSVVYKCADLGAMQVKKTFVKLSLEEMNSTDLGFLPPQRCEGVSTIPDCSLQTFHIPLYDGRQCKNIVIATRFIIEWRRGQITSVLGEVTLGDVAVGDTITQHHKVEYRDENSEIDTVERAGNPGIDIGRVAQSGIKGPKAINVSDENTLKLIQPDASGLCRNAGCRDIEFGHDTFTSCVIRVPEQRLLNCNQLKKDVAGYLNTMMPSEVMGRLGDNDVTKINDELRWKVIYRQNISEHYTQKYFKETDNRTNEALLPGWCVNVTSGIHLSILYTMSGRCRGVATFEIVGATINYTLDLWKPSCDNCMNHEGSSEGDKHDFTLTTSVQFIRVPPQEQPRIMKYWKHHDSSLCRYETCWREFMYPLTAAFTADPKPYTMGLTCVIIAVFIFYFAITIPWW